MVMRTLDIEKPVPPSLKVVNTDDSGPSIVGHVTPSSTTIEEYYIMFGASSFSTAITGTSRQRTLRTTAGQRQKKGHSNGR